MSTRRNIPQRKQTVRPSQGTENLSDEIVNIVEVKEHAQDFYVKHQKLILSVMTGLVLLVGGYLAYKYAYVEPKEKAAVEAMYQAEMQFARDSFASALDNPGGGAEGFASIADNYGGTKAANTAKLYAGICNLNLGKYEEAIEYLEDYSPGDDITPAVKFGSLGDAHAELGDLDKAADFYEKAANAGDDEFNAPFYFNKLGLLQFAQKKNEEALKSFKTIVDKYPTSIEAREAEKFVARLEK
ncbi:MAG TPA: tetratricopeptide repeat protein [Saprospiraceae bacterium]|nr:tetratricopeptide repeat protein [Saprospiraceae bacterium]HRG21019.1 tetratricopeptide repeat protein [Saprospiraceae bacterium]HRG64993.1 tetratricopeptide repeat protein [Saprospiraceae bacterium]